MKKNIIKFEKFINPNNKKYKNKNLDINDININVSYVLYIIIDTIDDEINNNVNITNNIEEIKEKYFEDNAIYAINILDMIICEVI